MSQINQRLICCCYCFGIESFQWFVNWLIFTIFAWQSPGKSQFPPHTLHTTPSNRNIHKKHPHYFQLKNSKIIPRYHQTENPLNWKSIGKFITIFFYCNVDWFSSKKKKNTIFIHTINPLRCLLCS
jgi:hypothetical protein